MQVSINIRQRMNRVVPLFGLDKGGQVRSPLAQSPPSAPPSSRRAWCFLSQPHGRLPSCILNVCVCVCVYPYDVISFR
jgi:hypothetical protein